jgi:ATP-binding cassette subfamily C (CFTR/MRP) protein 1
MSKYPVIQCGFNAIFFPLAPELENAFNPCFVTWLITAFALINIILGSYNLYTCLKSEQYGSYLPKSTGLTHYIRCNSVLLHTVLWFYLTSFTDIHERFADAKIIAFVSVAVCLAFVVLPLHFIEPAHKPTAHDSLVAFWPTIVILHLVLFFQDNYTNWRILKLIDAADNIKLVEFCLILNAVYISYSEYSSKWWRPTHKLALHYSLDPELLPLLLTPNIFDKLTYSWMNGLIVDSYKNQTVTQTDLPHSPAKLSAETATLRVLKYWNNDPSKEPSLLWPLTRAFGPIALYSFAYEFSARLLNFIQPQLLRLLLQYFGKKNKSILEGLLISILMFAVSLLQTSLYNQYFLLNLEAGLGCRSSLTSLIFKKLLKLSSESRIKTSSADVINLMSVDVNRIQSVAQDLSTLVLAPTDVILCVISLWPLLGKSTLAGISTMLLFIPLNTIIVKRQRAVGKIYMKNKDNRTRVINDILTSIKSIKLYAWEKPMLEVLSEARNNKELKDMAKIRVYNLVATFIWVLIPFLVSFTCFATFALTELTPLTAEIVFPALTLLNLLNGPLLYFPQVITATVEASISVSRIRKFLASTEIDHELISHLPRAEIPGTETVKVENCSFLWSQTPVISEETETTPLTQESDNNYALKNINFTAKKGQLVCILGKVGSGKSSLLYGLLGQLMILPGEDLNKKDAIIDIRGSIAYCAQLPWIMNATVKENVLFGHRYDEEFYQKALEACQLLQDIEILPDGDETQVGEKGVSLSGGQKARLALARAVYSRADIYLLDDILSAVDSHVGRKITESVLSKTGILSTKTIVMCTNSISVLKYSDEINLIQKGRIIEKSTFGEIDSENHPKLYELIQEFGKNDSAESSKVPSITPSIKDVNLDSGNGTSTEVEEDDEELEVDVAQELNNLKLDSDINLTRVLSPSNKSLRRASIDSFKWEPLKKLLPNLRSGQLNEVSQKGKVNWSVYMAYARACSMSGVIFWFFLLVLTSALSVAGNYWLKKWTESNSDAGSNQNVWRFITVYAFFGLSASIMTMVRGMVLYLWLAMNASVSIHDQMVKRIIRAPMGYFERTPIGRIMNRFTNDINKIDNSIPGTFSGFFSQVVKTLFTFGVVGSVMPLYIVVITLLSILYIYYEIYYVAISRELKRLVSISRSPIYAHLGESLNGLDTIRAFDQMDRFDYINNSNLDFNLKSVYMLRSINRWLTFRLQCIGSVGIFAATILAIYSLTTEHPLSPSMAGFVLTYALQVTSSLKMVVKFSAEVETNIVAVERCMEYVELPIEGGEEGDALSKLVKPTAHWPSKGVISFNDYSTRYRANLDLILRNINLHISSGEKVGVVGRTGAGKSSLALAIFRIIEPAGGYIEIDDFNTSALSLYDLRHNLCIIPQDSQLLAGTVRQNLDPFNYYSDEEVWKVLELAHLKKHIENMDDEAEEVGDKKKKKDDRADAGKNGGTKSDVIKQKSKLESKVYEGGSNFSLGQRQLMSLARVLLRMTDSQVLVLDEATAAVDVQTDKIIQETIRSEFKDKTIITIAHRLETVMDSDKIVTLDMGELKEFDSPANLLKNENGIFYSLCKQGGYI